MRKQRKYELIFFSNIIKNLNIPQLKLDDPTCEKIRVIRAIVR